MKPKFLATAMAVAVTVPCFSALAAGAATAATNTTIAVSGTKFLVDGVVTHPGKPYAGTLFNIRTINAAFADSNPSTTADWGSSFDPAQNTADFVAQLPSYAQAGVEAVTVGLQGGNPTGIEPAPQQQPWHVSAFNADGSLDPTWMSRIASIIQAANDNGLVVILSCYYEAQDHWLNGMPAIQAGVENVAAWLQAQGYHNVMLEIANEVSDPGYTYLNATDVVPILKWVRSNYPSLPVSVSFGGHSFPTAGTVANESYVSVHGNSFTPGNLATEVSNIRAMKAYKAHPKPIVYNEAGDNMSVFAQAVKSNVSWGFHDPATLQVVPANWYTRDAAEQAFFGQTAKL